MKYFFLFILSLNVYASPPACESALALQFPHAWRIDQNAVDQYLRANPQDQVTLQNYSRLAHFIEDPRNTEMFEWLGSQYFLSVMDRALPFSAERIEQVLEKTQNLYRSIGKEIDKEQLSLSIKNIRELQTEEFEQAGLFGLKYFTEGEGRHLLSDLSLNANHFSQQEHIPKNSLRAFLTIFQLIYSRQPEIHNSMEQLDGSYELFFSLLDPAEFESSHSNPKVTPYFDPTILTKIKSILKSLGQPVPTLGQMISHSEAARTYVMKGLTQKSKQEITPLEFEMILELTNQILLKKNPEIPPRFLNLIGILKNQVDDEDTIFNLLTNPKYNQKQQKEFRENFTLLTFQNILAIRAARLVLSDGDRHSSQFFAVMLSTLSQSDITIDQGFEPVLQKILTEVFLKKRVLSSQEYYNLLKSRLKQKIASTLKQFPQRPEKLILFSKPSIQPPLLSTRQERIDGYVKTELRVDLKPIEREVVQQTPSLIEQDLFSKLLDTPSDLTDARKRLLDLVKSDESVTITTKRFGFKYRVDFSADALHELTNPKQGWPQDFRPWLEAMRKGPARAQAQNGWIRMSSYEWKIKLITSPYRLYGYRDGEGLFHFTHFELEHR